LTEVKAKRGWGSEKPRGAAAGREQSSVLARFRKTRDGGLLAVVRSDGSSDAQRWAQGAFFAVHDLVHFALESELGYRSAFFGLLAQGWPFSAFSDKTDPRYHALPREALVVEHLVSVFSRRGLEGARHDPQLRELWCAEINAEWAACVGGPVDAISVERLMAASMRLEALLSQWAGLDAGGEMELEFEECT
jgi:hypothetical protein